MKHLSDQDYKIDVAESMIARGGSFVKKLGELILRADPINLMKLESLFRDYIDEYSPEGEK